MKKRILTFLLVVVLVAAMLPIPRVSAARKAKTTYDVVEMLASWKSKFHGKFWNYYDRNVWNNRAGEVEANLKAIVDNGTINDPNATSAQLGLTDKKPCTGGSYPNGCRSNYFHGGWQCSGFARFISYALFQSSYKSNPGDWNIYGGSSLNNIELQPGDLVWLNDSSEHAAVIADVSGGKLTCVEVFGSSGCQVSWSSGFNGQKYTTTTALMNALKSKGGLVHRYKYLATRHEYMDRCDPPEPCWVRLEPTKATTVKTLPCSAGTEPDSKDVVTLYPGDYIEATALICNSADNYWYQVEYNGQTCYVYSGETRVNDFFADVSASDFSVSENITMDAGTNVPLDGRIVSDKLPMCSVTADLSGSGLWRTYHDTVNTREYRLSDGPLPENVNLRGLPVGSYQLYFSCSVRNQYCTDGKTLREKVLSLNAFTCNIEITQNDYFDRCEDPIPCRVLLNPTKSTILKTLPCSGGTDSRSKDVVTLYPGDYIEATALIRNSAGNYWYRVEYNGQTCYIYSGETQASEFRTGAMSCDWLINGRDWLTQIDLMIEQGSDVNMDGRIISEYLPIFTVCATIEGGPGDEFSSIYIDDEICNVYQFSDGTIPGQMNIKELPVGRYFLSIDFAVMNYYCEDGKTVQQHYTWETAFTNNIEIVPVEPQNYTVTYHFDDANGDTETLSVEAGSTLTLSEYTLIRVGYRFLGWSTDPYATSESLWPGETIVPAGDVDFYPVWEPARVIPGDQPHHAKYVETRFPYDYFMYSFTPEVTAYYEFEDYGEMDTRIMILDPNGALLAQNDDKAPDQLTYYQQLYIEAGETVYIYVSMFDDLIGSITPSFLRMFTLNYVGFTGEWVAYGDSVQITPYIPQWEGYTFLGWSRDPNATTVQYRTGDSITILEDTTLYPVWKADNSSPFTDVAEGSFYYDPVLWAVENGITTGASATTFNPNGDCLRAHVVTFLHRAAGSPRPTSTGTPFADVKTGDFFYLPVLWAVENNITKGTSSTRFGSFDVCNRAAVVTFLWRAAGSPPTSLTDHPFTDVPDGAFYEDAVLWALENGITQGISATRFGPTSPCNRAQVVTFLYRAYTG